LRDQGLQERKPDQRVLRGALSEAANADSNQSTAVCVDGLCANEQRGRHCSSTGTSCCKSAEGREERKEVAQRRIVVVEEGRRSEICAPRAANRFCLGAKITLVVGATDVARVPFPWL